MESNSSERTTFDLVLEEMMQFQTHRPQFNLVLKELITQREKALLAEERQKQHEQSQIALSQMKETMAEMKKEFQEERRAAIEERRAAQHEREMMFSKIFEVVGHHKAEGETSRRSQQEEKEATVSNMMTKKVEEMEYQQEALTRLVEEQRAEIRALRSGSLPPPDKVKERKTPDAPNTQRAVRPTPSAKRKKPEFNSLSEMETDCDFDMIEFPAEVEPAIEHADKVTDPSPSNHHRISFAAKTKMKMIAEEIYELRTNTVMVNIRNIEEVMSKYPNEFAPIIEYCPNFRIIIAHMLVFRLGLRVQDVDWTSDMKDWNEEDCRRVGRSMATLMRTVQTGLMAVESWRRQYVQLSELFDEVVGFEDFIVTIAKHLLRDNRFGMVFRVSVGAALSTIDALTDIYVVSTYYESEELIGQANYLLGMITANLFLQCVLVWCEQRKTWTVKLRESLICLLLLRPAVDAYRVSVGQEDENSQTDALTEMIMNKGIELATESIPGCVLQVYVWLLSPNKAGTFALLSIGISALTTGFSSAMISFDLDVDIPHRESQPRFYGYIPDDNGKRFRCFVLMTLMSTLHNLSRSLGLALLAVSDGGMTLVMYASGGEMLLFLALKALRNDFYFWPRFEGLAAVITSLTERIFIKVIVDYTGCIHMRHPFEMGGLAFSLSMLWAQVFPFIALKVMELNQTVSVEKTEDEIFSVLIGNLIPWGVTTIMFFCTIDIDYLTTFFGTKTAAQYACERFLDADNDSQRWSAAFENRMGYKKAIQAEVREWVANNIEQWKNESQPKFFKIEMIPDEFLPEKIYEEEGGIRRKRSSVSVFSIFEDARNIPMKEMDVESSVERWKVLAGEIFDARSNNYKSNFLMLKRIFSENEDIFNNVTDFCPKFREILSHILEDKLGLRVQKVDWTSEMNDWGLEECRRVGCSFATFLRKRKTGEHAIDAWRLHYAQLDVLFKEIVGFEEFMLVIADNTLRDSIYGMVYRVSMGAALSMTDAATDIYVISTYYHSEELYGQANAMLAMLLGNIISQLIVVFAQYSKKGWLVIGREAMISIFFLRPPVDAYRVSTNHQDSTVTLDQHSELICNKCSELAFESIPGCVLQLYVWLKNPEIVGTYALASIGISCLTTGFVTASIAFDCDVDVTRRKNQPKFYGYIPNDNSLRGRCFFLLMFISALHNLSRSLGCALLALSGVDNLILMFVGGEVCIYLLCKIVRRDFFYWMRLSLSGSFAFLLSILFRIGVKIIVDFSGCMHFRHPYEMGGISFILSIVWAQVFPFVALQFYSAGDSMPLLPLFLVVSFFLWLLFSIVFFCSVDLSFINTFYSTKTSAEYTCERFLDAKDDKGKWAAAFENRIEYKKSIEREVKEWVADNIEKWKREKPDWFNIEKIPDEFLPKDVFEAEGGTNRRRRKSTSFREIVGLGERHERRVHPEAVEDMKVEDL